MRPRICGSDFVTTGSDVTLSRSTLFAWRTPSISAIATRFAPSTRCTSRRLTACPRPLVLLTFDQRQVAAALSMALIVEDA
jgi:hypothetical protein